MNSKVFTKILPYMIISSLILNGCGVEKANCDLPNRHVHLYTKDIDSVTLSRYLESEALVDDGWYRNDDYINITSNDAKMYKLLDKGDSIFHNNLFNGLNNFDYLYNEMAKDEDYLEFYYARDVVVTWTTTDSDGKKISHTRVDHEEGWHSNQFSPDNTGRVRLCHHRYFAFRPYIKNGKLELEESKPVDDIREVLEYYIYVSEDFSTIVTKEHYLLPVQLLSLSPEDFVDDFDHPDLENHTKYLTKTKTR